MDLFRDDEIRKCKALGVRFNVCETWEEVKAAFAALPEDSRQHYEVRAALSGPIALANRLAAKAAKQGEPVETVVSAKEREHEGQRQRPLQSNASIGRPSSTWMMPMAQVWSLLLQQLG